MYAITSPDGPEFEEGDEVVFTTGALEGNSGEVTGYDERNDVYFVRVPGNPFIVSAVPSVLELVEDDWDDDDIDDEFVLEDPTGDISIGSRVVVIYGQFIGAAGVVIQENRTLSVVNRTRVVNVALDHGEKIVIAITSLELSIYQGEALEAVPSV